MVKILSVDKKLLVSFSIIFVALVASFAMFLYYYMSNALIETEINNLQPSVHKISEQIDMTYSQLNNAAASYTSDTENMFIMSRIYNDKDEFGAVEHTTLSQNLDSIYSIVPDLYKIIIFVPEQDLFFSYIRDSKSVSSIPPKYKSQEFMNFSGYYKLQGPHLDEWSNNPEVVFSTCYQFSTPFNVSYGFLQVEVPYAVLDNVCSLQNSTTDNSMVLVYDEQGKLVYPYVPIEKQYNQKNFEKIYDRFLRDNQGLTKDDYDNSIYYARIKSNYTGWTTVVAVDGKSIEEKLNNTRMIIISLTVSIFFICLITYGLLIKRMLRPLRELTVKVRKTNLDKLALKIDAQGNNDLHLLNEAFENMFDRLSESIQKEYEGKIREIESLYASLQSQINPHFLYNTLNVISARCEDDDSETAVDMCIQLSQILRYSASTPGSKVDFAREIKHSIYYLQLIQLHYENDLTYEINISDELNDMIVPKFTLQPLVENAINHGFNNVLPPWNIEINGRRWGNRWEITVKDNGDAMIEEERIRLNEQIQLYKNNYLQRKLTNNLNMGGMGVLNTYSRLLICFGEDFYMTVEQNEPRGLCVRFGGVIDD